MNRPEGYYIEYIYILARKAAELGLLITSMIFFWRVASSYTHSWEFPPFMIYGCNVFFTSVGVMMIDITMSEIGVFVSKHMRTKEYKNKYTRGQRNYLRFCLGVGIILLVATSTMSLWSSAEITYGVVGEFDNQSTVEAVKEQKDLKDKILQDAIRDYDEAVRTEKSRIKAAKREGKAKVKAAVNTATSADHKRLFKNGNKWFWKENNRRKYKEMIEYRERILAARHDSTQLVVAAISKAEKLQTTKDQVRAEINSDRTAELLAEAGAAGAQLHRLRSHNVQYGIITLEIIWGLAVPLFFFLLALHRKYFGQQVEETNGGIFVLVEKIAQLVTRLITAIGNTFLGPLQMAVDAFEGNALAVAGMEAGLINATEEEALASVDESINSTLPDQKSQRKAKKKKTKKKPQMHAYGGNPSVGSVGECDYCDGKYMKKRIDHRFCSASCRNAWHHERKHT